MTERTDTRALCFEIEVPSSRPTVLPPHHPRWEKLLPAPWRKARRRARTEAAFAEWSARVRAWELAGRPPDWRRVYVPRAEVDTTELPDGSHEVSVRAPPSDAEIVSVTYPH